MSGKGKSSDGWPETLEETKKEYQGYADLGKLRKMLEFMEEENPAEHPPPSPEHPLTTNSFRIRPTEELPVKPEEDTV